MLSLCQQDKQAPDQTRSPTKAEQDGSRPHEYHQYPVEEEAERQLPEQDGYYTMKEDAEEETEDGKYVNEGYEEQVCAPAWPHACLLFLHQQVHALDCKCHQPLLVAAPGWQRLDNV